MMRVFSFSYILPILYFLMNIKLFKSVQNDSRFINNIETFQTF